MFIDWDRSSDWVVFESVNIRTKLISQIEFTVWQKIKLKLYPTVAPCGFARS